MSFDNNIQINIYKVKFKYRLDKYNIYYDYEN